MMLPPHSANHAAESGKYTSIANIKNMQKHRRNTRKHIAGGVVIFVLALTFCRAGAPVSAQIVTPLPGPAATATAAAQNQAAALNQQRQGEAMKAQADAARARAAQLEAAGNDAISQGQASYDSAASDAAQATAALQAQQVGVASELITRAQSNISTGKAQIDAARESLAQMSSMVDAQAGMIISLTNRLQVAETDKRTIKAAYEQVITNNEQGQKSNTILSIFLAVVVIAFLFGLLAFALRIRESRRSAAEPPDAQSETISGEYTVSGEDERE